MMEFLASNELAILRWVHILAMVYWLGGEWGVFQTSYHVTNPALSLEERRRHMETAYRIDILARTGIVLLLPLGLHMGKIYGFVPLLDGAGVWWMWLFFAIWLAMTWTAFIQRETDIGIAVTPHRENCWRLSSDMSALVWVEGWDGPYGRPSRGPDHFPGPSNLVVSLPKNGAFNAFALCIGCSCVSPVMARALDRAGSGISAMGPQWRGGRSLPVRSALSAGGRLNIY